jgi:hypothetical protein
MATSITSSPADDLGRRTAALLELGRSVQAGDLLIPILSRRTSFRLLDRIGAKIGAGSIRKTNAFLEELARGKAMGRYYPETFSPWRMQQARRIPKYRALMLRKATTYLSAAARTRVYRAAK